MGAMVVKEAVKRAGIQPSDVDEVVIGQVRRSLQRMASLQEQSV